MINSINDHDHDLIQPMKVPIIDVSFLQDSHKKFAVIKEIQEACRNSGIFHVINHGVSELVIEEALEVNKIFFDLPEIMKEEIMELGSRDWFSPAKLITFRRSTRGIDLLPNDSLRLYANPFEDFIDFWPRNPADYREKMGRYAEDARRLAITLFGAIMESLNLDTSAKHLEKDFEKGMQTVAANNYPPPDPESSIKLGSPPHSDHGIITILFQGAPGLQVLDMADATWKAVPIIEGSLQVHVGDLMEVLSNGIYKSVFHRVIIPSSNKARMSLASFHSFEMDELVEPAIELVSEDCPKRYKGFSARDIINCKHSGEVERLIDSLKI